MTSATLGTGRREVKVARLREWPENPRTITDDSLEALKRSMQEDPEVLKARPLICLPDGTVIAGNMRLRAAVDLGLSTLPVYVIEADAKRARQIALRDNNEFGEWVSDDLAAMLLSIESDGGDLAALGFDERELVAFMASLDGAGKGGDPDAVPDPPDDPITQPGDLIALGPHRLLCGDATSSEDMARLMGDQQAALLFTSPPYLDARDYGGESDLSLEHLAGFIGTCAPHSLVQVVNLGILRRDNAVVRFWDAYIDAAEAAGLKLLSWNVWNRGAPFSMAQQTAMFPIEHEWLFVFGADRREVHRIVANNKPTQPGRHVTNRQRDGSLKSRTTQEGHTHRRLGTVQDLPPEAGNDQEHPAVFPVALPSRYISALVKARQSVLDPMAGSGTTLIAAEAQNRRCFAADIDPVYCDVIVRRWEEFTGKKAKRP